MGVEAHTLTKVGKTEIYGRTKVVQWDMNVTNYNSTSHIVLTAANLGLKRIENLVFAPQGTPDEIVTWDGNKTTATITVTVADTGAEAATDTVPGVIRVTAYGK